MTTGLVGSVGEKTGSLQPLHCFMCVMWGGGGGGGGAKHHH